MLYRLEGCGSHNVENRWWLGMSASWAVGLARRWGARQTRTHNMQPMAPELSFFTGEQSCPVFACHRAGLSFTWNFVLTVCVYKYISLFLGMSHQYCFPLISLEPKPHSPSALLSARILLSPLFCSVWLLTWGYLSYLRLLSGPHWGFCLHAVKLEKR